MNNFISKNLISNIYDEFIVPKLNATYLEKYKNISFNLQSSRWPWKDKDFSRVISLLEFKLFMEKNNNTFNKSLIYNGPNDPELEYINCNNFVFVDYDTNKEKDLHLLKADIKYDFFMTNQTLEHTYDPCLILRNVYEIMNFDGLIYFNVPSLCPPHSTPFHHYNGFTPTGLGAIVQQAGFKILDIGFWGNKEYIMKLFNNNSWPDYTSLNDYCNDFNYSAISWIFAKK